MAFFLRFSAILRWNKRKKNNRQGLLHVAIAVDNRDKEQRQNGVPLKRQHEGMVQGQDVCPGRENVP